ncbi:MAG: FkbM family methyltransferase [Cyclobacteriaceae bacterium]|nr:FkbM family methyltransferase [Cyclobacteriaceae bacterium]
MKKVFKEFAKSTLRKLGLLKWIRKVLYSRSKRSFLAAFEGVSHYEYKIRDRIAKFSVEDPYSASFVGYYLNSKVYEPEAVELLMQQLSPNDVFVDVGANIGYFTVVVGVCLPDTKIVAFEMGHENFRILERNIKLNGLTTVEMFEAAVADCSGTLFHQDSAVGSAVLKIMEENRDIDPDVVKVESVSLDDFFASKAKNPTFVKIDVEGAEMKVLQGMKKLLKSSSLKLLIEIHPRDLVGFSSSREEVLEYLKGFSFTIQSVPSNDRKNELVFAWK